MGSSTDVDWFVIGAWLVLLAFSAVVWLLVIHALLVYA